MSLNLKTQLEAGCKRVCGSYSMLNRWILMIPSLFMKREGEKQRWEGGWSLRACSSASLLCHNLPPPAGPPSPLSFSPSHRHKQTHTHTYQFMQPPRLLSLWHLFHFLSAGLCVLAFTHPLFLQSTLDVTSSPLLSLHLYILSVAFFPTCNLQHEPTTSSDSWIFSLSFIELTRNVPLPLICLCVFSVRSCD